VFLAVGFVKRPHEFSLLFIDGLSLEKKNQNLLEK